MKCIENHYNNIINIAIDETNKVKRKYFEDLSNK